MSTIVICMIVAPSNTPSPLVTHVKSLRLLTDDAISVGNRTQHRGNVANDPYDLLLSLHPHRPKTRNMPLFFYSILVSISSSVKAILSLTSLSECRCDFGIFWIKGLYSLPVIAFGLFSLHNERFSCLFRLVRVQLILLLATLHCNFTNEY